MVELQCETDFVASNESFKSLAKELAMQVSSMQPATIEEFVKQEYVRDPKLTIEQIMNRRELLKHPLSAAGASLAELSKMKGPKHAG